MRHMSRCRRDSTRARPSPPPPPSLLYRFRGRLTSCCGGDEQLSTSGTGEPAPQEKLISLAVPLTAVQVATMLPSRNFLQAAACHCSHHRLRREGASASLCPCDNVIRQVFSHCSRIRQANSVLCWSLRPRACVHNSMPLNHLWNSSLVSTSRMELPHEVAQGRFHVLECQQHEVLVNHACTLEPVRSRCRISTQTSTRPEQSIPNSNADQLRWHTSKS